MGLSRTNQLIARAAGSLGATVEPLLAEPTDWFLRLRKGERQVIVSKTRSPFLTQVAQSLSNHKWVARRLLAGHGVPVPECELLTRSQDIGRRGQELLQRFGTVVVKPNCSNRGHGLSSEVREQPEFLRACERARRVDLDGEVLVEPFLPGTNLRVAVIGGRYEAACEVARPVLRGDGRRSASQLVAEFNADPRRCDSRLRDLLPLDRIDADGELAQRLEVSGRSADELLPAGFALELCSEELETRDFSEQLHESWQTLACRACELLGVDVGGVDFRGERSAFLQPVGSGNAVLLEVNVLPALHLHELPTEGPSRPVFAAFVAYCLQLPGAPQPQGQVRI